MVYLHDGTLDGFLTCVYKHYYDHKVQGIYESSLYEPELFEAIEFVETDPTKANRVHKAITDKFTEDMYMDLYRTFLSNVYEKDIYLLEYIVLGFKQGAKLGRLRSLDTVYRVQKIGRQVGFECHRFLGLMRFADLGHCLYSTFEPDHNIITLMAEHFADRLKEERFIIHDVKRKLAVMGYGGRWVLTDFDQHLVENLPQEELLFRTLWKGYFDAIGIEGRVNKKLQQSFVPLKYRKHLVEFDYK